MSNSEHLNDESTPTYPKITRRQYRANKKNLIHKEKQNTNRIYIIYCAGHKGWCELAEHSALFFYYEIAKRLGSKHIFFTDDDLILPYSIGYLRVQSPEVAKTLIKKAGLYESDGYDNQQTYYIELKKHFTITEIDKYREKEVKRRLDANMITPTANLAPEFYQALINTGHRLNTVCSNFPRLTAYTIGKDIATLTFDTVELYHKITRANKHQITEIQQAWHTIHDNLYRIIFKLQALCDLRLTKNPVGIIEIIDSLQRLLKLSERECNQKHQNTTPKSTSQSKSNAAKESK